MHACATHNVLHACATHPTPPRPCRLPVNTHRLEDQGRRDDLWGWFYCLVELVEGESEGGCELSTGRCLLVVFFVFLFCCCGPASWAPVVGQYCLLELEEECSP